MNTLALLKKKNWGIFVVPINIFFRSAVSMIFIVLKKNCALWSLQTNLLCIVGELAGGGFVAVAVGVSDRS